MEREYSLPGIMTFAIEAGMDAHVAKPIKIPALMKALADVFSDRSSFKSILNAHRREEDPVSHVMRIYFEMQRSMSVLPGGFFAYKAEQPEKLIFANDLCCSIRGCKNFEVKKVSARPSGRFPEERTHFQLTAKLRN